MNRLVAYKQRETANIVENGNFVDVLADFSFYEEWTRHVSGANTLPSATSIPNPANDTFNSVVRFHGSTTNNSKIRQTVPCEIGKVYAVRYEIVQIKYGTGNTPNTCRFNGIATSPTINIPNTVGIHTVNVLCEQADDQFEFQVDSGEDADTFLSWITIEEVTQYELDLFEDEEIVVTYEIDDIRSIDSKNSGYTKSFSIPASKVNSKFFQQVYLLTDGGNWNPYAKASAILYSEGVEVFKGFLKLDDIVKKDNNAIFNITLFEEVADLKTELGNKTLAALPWDSLVHDYTKQNIVDSWTGELTTINDQETAVIKYPFCNWIGNFDYQNNEIFLNRFQDAFRPWVQAKYIWDKIFDQSSFQYVSTFLNSPEFTKAFVDWDFGESFSMFGGGTEDFAEFRCDTPFNNVFADAPSVSAAYQKPNFDSVTQVGDAQIGGNDNDFFSLTTDTFTATEDNQTVYVYLDALMFGASGGSFFCAVEHDSSVAGCLPNQYFEEDQNILATTVLDEGGTSTSWSSVDFPNLKRMTHSVGTFTLNQGETLTVKFRQNTGVVMKLGFATVMFQVQAGKQLNLGMVTSRTKIKQFDFVKAIVQMFNLVIIPNDSNPKFLRIEPAQSYYESGVTLDWTKLIDMNEINIVPHEVAQEYRFRMKDDGEDYNLQEYSKTNDGKMYGEHVKIHDFEVISKDIEVHENVLFSPTVIGYSSGMYMPQIYGKEDGEFVEIANNIRILFETGVHPAKPYSSPTQNNGQFSSQATALFFSSSQNYEPLVDDIQLDYGQSLAFTNGGTVPFKTLFFEYYSDLVKQLTQRESRIVKVKANLSSKDILNFEFKDTIFFENQLYRVNKIDYNTTEGELSTVELIRLSSESNFVFDKTNGKPCKAYPSAIMLNGEVLFASAVTGLPVVASKDCCEEYGYTYYDAPIYKCNMKDNAYGHGFGHGSSVGHTSSSWSGGHHLVIGNKSTNGFGHNTHNSIVVGNKNTAQSNTKNLSIVGENNEIANGIFNSSVVGTGHRIGTKITDFSETVQVENSHVIGQVASVHVSNSSVLSSNNEKDNVLQKVECIYKGTVADSNLTEIFLNGVSGSRYPFTATNSFVDIEINIHGIVAAGRDIGKYTRRKLIATGGVTGSTKIRIDDVDEVSHHSNHGSSWTTTIDVASDSLRIQVAAGGVREPVKWMATIKISEQSFN